MFSRSSSSAKADIRCKTYSFLLVWRMRRITLDPACLRNLLDYDPLSGILTWRSREPYQFRSGRVAAAHLCRRWNRDFAGKTALAAQCQKRFVGYVLGTRVFAHCVIWAWMTGEWPTLEIDHIDGDGFNNRWANLRQVSHRQNGMNTKRPSDNTSGHIGVSKMRCGRWQAYINRNRKRVSLGRFSTIEDAIAARRTAQVCEGYHPNHGR